MNSIGNYGNYSYFPRQRYSGSPEQRPSVGESAPSGTGLTKADVINAQLDAYQKRWDDAKQAIDRLQANAPDTAQMKKANAAERISLIKDQIKMLMAMGHIGNPKANARQIAQLARELGAAAREYAAAGGGNAPQEAAPAAHTATNTAGGDSASPNVSQGGGATADAPAPASGTPTGLGAEDEKAGNNIPDATSAAPAAAALADSSRQYQDSLKQQNREALQSAISGLQKKSSDSRADAEFVKEVRNLASQLKALARQQEARMRQAGEQTTDSEIAKTRQALNEVEKAVASIAGGEASFSVNVFA